MAIVPRSLKGLPMPEVLEPPVRPYETVPDFFPPPVPFTLPYTGERMRWAIEIIGWTVNQFAHRMDMSQGSTRQMLAGKRFIPDTLGIWLETLAQTHLTFPKPLGWWEKHRQPVDVDDTEDAAV
jgi:hypothetical protein